MTPDRTPVDVDVLVARELMRAYGPLMTGENLRIALGYPSQASFKQATARSSLPVPVFNIKNRRGKFALTQDVASWLVDQRRDAVPVHAGTSEKSEEK